MNVVGDSNETTTNDTQQPATTITTTIMPIETTPMMLRPGSSTAVFPDGLTTNAQVQENYGHFFVKKNFHKPTYCHHCAEMLWGLIGQGNSCEGKIQQIKSYHPLILII